MTTPLPSADRAPAVGGDAPHAPTLRGVCIDSFTDGRDLVIAVGGKIIRFEFGHYFGPMPVTRTGAERDIGPRHPFWRAVSLWRAQGSVVEGSTAVWREPKKPVLQHIGGRHYRVIERGEHGHDW